MWSIPSKSGKMSKFLSPIISSLHKRVLISENIANFIILCV